MLKISIHIMGLKNTLLKLQPHLSGDNDLITSLRSSQLVSNKLQPGNFGGQRIFLGLERGQLHILSLLCGLKTSNCLCQLGLIKGRAQLGHLLAERFYLADIELLNVVHLCKEAGVPTLSVLHRSQCLLCQGQRRGRIRLQCIQWSLQVNVSGLGKSI